MSLGDHLDELRLRLVLSILPLIPIAIVLFVFGEAMLDIVNRPLMTVLKANGLPATLQVLYPSEQIVLYMKLAVIGSIVIAVPWIVWQVWCFVKPGLFQHERRFVYLLIPGSFILSIVGTLMLYFLMLPMMLQMFIGMGAAYHSNAPPNYEPRVAKILAKQPFIEVRTQTPDPLVEGQAWLQWPELKLRVAVKNDQGVIESLAVDPPNDTHLSQQYQLSAYVDFVLLMELAIVLTFQMPMVVVLLGWVGIASPEWLAQNRKYAILICGFVSAVVTPPDVLSMILMLVPLYGLYELGIVLLRLFPAKVVADGSRWPWRKPHKSSAQTEHLRRPERSEGSIARKEPDPGTTDQSRHEPPDESNLERDS